MEMFNSIVWIYQFSRKQTQVSIATLFESLELAPIERKMGFD